VKLGIRGMKFPIRGRELAGKQPEKVATKLRQSCDKVGRILPASPVHGLDMGIQGVPRVSLRLMKTEGRERFPRGYRGLSDTRSIPAPSMQGLQ